MQNLKTLVPALVTVAAVLAALPVFANEAPIASDDSYETLADVAISVDDPGVLTNDTDADCDLLSAILVQGPDPLSEFTLFSDGAFEYRPPVGFVGVDTSTYVGTGGEVAVQRWPAHGPGRLGRYQQALGQSRALRHLAAGAGARQLCDD